MTATAVWGASLLVLFIVWQMISKVLNIGVARKKMETASRHQFKAEVADLIRGDVRIIAACVDHESVDAPPKGSVCTNALIKTMKHGVVGTWERLLKGMHTMIKLEHEPHVPVLSMSRKFEVSERMSFRNPSGGGRTRSLLIGINYANTKDERLPGYYTDVHNMKTVLKSQGYNVDDEHCKILLDNGPHVSAETQWLHRYPGKQGIRDGFEWLIQGANEGDSLFLFFSGRGDRVRDMNSDEGDGFNEAIVPADYNGKESSLITDDIIFADLVLAVPERVVLTAVMDCCRRGGIVDLPYRKAANDIGAGKDYYIVSSNSCFNLARAKRVSSKTEAHAAKEAGLPRSVGEAVPKRSSKGSARTAYSSAKQLARTSEEKRLKESIPGDIWMISACEDYQSALERTYASISCGEERSRGACTSAVIKSFGKKDDGTAKTWLELLTNVSSSLKGTKSVEGQAPRLSMSPSMSHKNSLMGTASFINTSGKGKTRALLIGIEYKRKRAPNHPKHDPLHGSHWDTEYLKKEIERQGYKVDREHCKVLIDTGRACLDVKDILDGIRWLVKDASPGDSLFFSFSGHGGTRGCNQVICAIDGDITDNDLYTELVLAIPSGVYLTAVVDSCGSGTIFNLPYIVDKGLICKNAKFKMKTVIEAEKGKLARDARAARRAARNDARWEAEKASITMTQLPSVAG